MKTLVTGGTGFIGRHLVRKLISSDNEVTCLVRNIQRAKFLQNMGAKLVYGDITRKETLENFPIKSMDYLFHCAAYVGVKDKDLLHKTNVLGTENTCRLGLKLSVKKMVYASSVAVVSGNNLTPLKENLPYKATNAYGASKIEAEKIVLDHRKKGLKSAIVRPCCVYGEDEPHLLCKLLSWIKLGLLPLINNGETKLHLVYVKNVVDAMLYSLQKQEFESNTFFIADSEVLNIREIATILLKAQNINKLRHLPKFLTPILLKTPYLGNRLKSTFKDRVYSIEKITSLGFKHQYAAQESLYKSAKALPSFARSSE